LKTNDSSKFRAEEGAVVISPFQFAFLTNPSYDGVSSSGGFQRIRGKIEIDYQNWDLLMSRIICSAECYTIAPFVGAEGLLLKQKIKTHSRLHSIREGTVIDTPGGFGNGRALTNWKSDFHAYGIKFGTDYIYQLGDCFQFFTRGSFTIAVGENSGKNHQSLTRNSEDGIGGPQAVVVIKEKEDESSIMINGYNIQLGFIYETETCGYDVAFRAGYEFVKWHNVPKPRRFPGGDNGNDNAYNRAISTSPSKSTVGFHGLMAGACLTF